MKRDGFARTMVYTKTDLVFGFTGNKILVKVSPDKKR